MDNLEKVLLGRHGVDPCWELGAAGIWGTPPSGTGLAEPSKTVNPKSTVQEINKNEVK